MELKDKLKKMRELRNMTTTELAEAAGIGQSAVSEIESGKRKNPGIETITKLSKALGVSPIYFFEENARTVFDVAELEKMLPDDLKSTLLKERFLPYLLLSKRAFEEQIPASVLQKIIDGIIESISTLREGE